MRNYRNNYYGFQKFKSAMFLPVATDEVASEFEPGGSLEVALRQIRSLGINTVFQLIPNTATAAYVKSYLDTCSANGFKSGVGFVDRLVSTGASGSQTWETTPVATAIQPNVDHAALLTYATIDEPFEVCFRADMQTLYTQLRTTSGSATYLLKADSTFVDQWVNFSGELESFGAATKTFFTGMCDISAHTKLGFEDYTQPLAYLNDLILRVHSAARDEVFRAVNPFPYWIQIGVLERGNNRIPTEWELHDHLHTVLNTVYPAGRPDRISWQGSNVKNLGDTDLNMKDPQLAFAREWAARLSQPDFWTF